MSERSVQRQPLVGRYNLRMLTLVSLSIYVWASHLDILSLLFMKIIQNKRYKQLTNLLKWQVNEIHIRLYENYMKLLKQI